MNIDKLIAAAKCLGGNWTERAHCSFFFFPGKVQAEMFAAEAIKEGADAHRFGTAVEIWG